MSTIKVNSIKNTSTDDGGIAIDNSGHVQIDGQQLPTTGALSNRNLVINGAMQVAQRGTSTTGVGTAVAYNTVDRWRFADAQNPPARYTETQSTDAPDGFGYSRKFEVTTADSSVDADETQYTDQFIEAQNLQHLAYGTSAAKKITLSFYVKSSVAQTFGVGLTHEDGGGNYGVSYTVNSANTWEHKTLTFNGNTSTAINNDNGKGIRVRFGLAAGSNYADGSDATAWEASGTVFGQHSNTWVGTVGNTWQITGVQLEVGEKATPFEHRSYGDELARCQRYYYAHVDGTAINYATGIYYSATLIAAHIHFPVTMRAAPSLEHESGTDYYIAFANGTSDTFNSFNIARSGINGAALDANNTGGSGTAGHGAVLGTGNANSFIAFAAEL